MRLNRIGFRAGALPFDYFQEASHTFLNLARLEKKEIEEIERVVRQLKARGKSNKARLSKYKISKNASSVK
jgi:hypothetical protein